LIAIEFEEDDVTYTRYDEGELKRTFSKTGFDVLLGNQFFLNDLLVFDLFIGVGFRYSFDDDFKQFTKFANDWGGIGYSGVMLRTGLRVGIHY